MARKVRYYYDEESCTFQEEKITPKSVIRYGASLFSLAALLALTGLAIYFFAYDDPKNALLKSENQELVSRIQDFNRQFSMLESQVDSLQMNDKYYRSILGTEAIAEGIWEGGKGGAGRIYNSNMPEELTETEMTVDKVISKVELQGTSYQVLYDLLDSKEEELRHTPAIRPVPGRIISGFGMRLHPILKYRKPHTGLDMQADKGTPVRASADGIVKFAGRSRGGYGIQVHINHGSFGYESKYAHLKAVNVKQGQKVNRGEIIGWSGNTGLSKGPHLHYEIVHNNNKINPIDYFYGDLSPEEYVKAREEAKVDNMSMD
ncbi:MAG: M23 family metallopeptidase [Bacteroidota bacterium]